jgi:hypothetical protein
MANRKGFQLGLIRPDRSARSSIFTIEQDFGEISIDDVDLYITEEGGRWGAFHASIHPSKTNNPSPEVHVRMNGDIVYKATIELSRPVIPVIAIAIHNDLHHKNVDAFQAVNGQQKPLNGAFLYKREPKPGHFHLFLLTLVNENKVEEISSTLPIDVRYFLPPDAATYGILVHEILVPEDHLGVEMYEDPPDSKILAKATWVREGVWVSFDGVERFKIPTICSVIQPVSKDDLRASEPAPSGVWNAGVGS